MPLNREIYLIKMSQWFQIADSLNYQSYDPMDLLYSPMLRNAQKISAFGSRVLVQIGMRTGERLRQMLQVKPHEEAKTLSDYLSAAAILCNNEQPWAGKYIDTLTRRLKAKAIRTANGIGWGLEFPYTTRFVNAAARTPNVYQTMNAIQALLDVYEITKDTQLLQVALQGVQFIIRDLGSYQVGGYTWFRYFPGRPYPVINIQASLASLFARLGNMMKDWHFHDLADRLAYTVISVQQPNGSWPYSYGRKARFIDGFHTGFILQGLKEYSQHRGRDVLLNVLIPLEKGFEFYLEHLILPEGLPRYYADGPVKPDGQNFAQCIQTLVTCSPEREHVELAARVWDNLFDYVYLPGPDNQTMVSGTSQSILDRQYTQLRWTVAPVVLATAHLYQKIQAGEPLEKVAERV